ncbi:hypothetical protein, partial [Streptomyces alkaliterrae]|uniref:hypothetical protein n=1 Tax=Streptomyces alkaliterrae TaxID=2213162 RepID=UPI003F696624
GLHTPRPLPVAKAVPPATESAPVQPVAAPTPRTSFQVSPAGLAAGTGAVLVLGAVLVSLLLATALTAVSVAVCAVVLKSLTTTANRRNR